MFLQEVVDLSISYLGLLIGPQHPKGFHWTRLLVGDNVSAYVFPHLYILVDDAPPTSYGVFQHIQCFDVRCQFSIN
jgi:hypothetical protein